MLKLIRKMINSLYSWLTPIGKIYYIERFGITTVLTKGTEEASGYDLRMFYGTADYYGTKNIKEIRNIHPKIDHIIIYPYCRVVVPTGIKLELPKDVEAVIRPRSGMSSKEGLMCVLGTIDSDYRGELGVILYNTTDSFKSIEVGQRIAQLVFQKKQSITLIETNNLTHTSRGEKGFGSTGK